ncbi:MAG: hypothetical protein C0448_05655 [Sphingobacteriaceae bacterium]|nr:hypothetical protein [Sphingobacteriaceae bacterium]
MKVVKLPSRFLLTQKHINVTISILNELVKDGEKELAIDFSGLIDMRKGDLLVLIAQSEKATIDKKIKLYRTGGIPNVSRIKKLFTAKSVFFHVNKTIEPSNLTDAEKENLVNPDIIDSVVKDLKKIGIKDYYVPFNIFLTELVGNAVEHGIKAKNINWWLTHEIDRKNQTVIYTFVDMGMGIINSHKEAGLPFRYNFVKHENIVLDSLYGRLGSSTKEPNRGRGLQQLKDMIEKELISNLVLITNTVSLEYIDGTFVANNNPNFVGTYFSWTISKENIKKWKSVK